MVKWQLRNVDLAWREIDTEVVAVDVSKSVYLSANSSGAILWRMLAKGATRAQLADALQAEYGIERARAEADVDAFVENLRRRDLLTS